MYLDIFRVLKDSFGNKVIKSLNDHPWYVVLIFCIDIYYILKCVLLLYYCDMLNKSEIIESDFLNDLFYHLRTYLALKVLKRTLEWFFEKLQSLNRPLRHIIRRVFM